MEIFLKQLILLFRFGMGTEQDNIRLIDSIECWTDVWNEAELKSTAAAFS